MFFTVKNSRAVNKTNIPIRHRSTIKETNKPLKNCCVPVLCKFSHKILLGSVALFNWIRSFSSELRLFNWLVSFYVAQALIALS